MWTDSTTVLQRLHSCSKLPIFVGNRTGEIWSLPPLISGITYLAVITQLIPGILRTTDWPFKPDTRVIDKIRLKGPSCDIDICLENSSNFVVDVLTEKTFPSENGRDSIQL